MVQAHTTPIQSVGAPVPLPRESRRPPSSISGTGAVGLRVLAFLTGSILMIACGAEDRARTVELRHYVCDGSTWTEVPESRSKTSAPDAFASATMGNLIYLVQISGNQATLSLHESADHGEELRVPLESSSRPVDIALAWVRDVLHVVVLAEDGALSHGTYQHGSWGSFGRLDVSSSMGSAVTRIAIAAQNSLMHLCLLDSKGQPFHTLHDGMSWSPIRRVSNRTGLTEITCAAQNRTLHLLAVAGDGSLWHFLRDSTWYAGLHVRGAEASPRRKIQGRFAGATLYLVELTEEGRLGVTTWQGGAWGGPSIIPTNHGVRDFAFATSQSESPRPDRLFLCTVSQ